MKPDMVAMEATSGGVAGAPTNGSVIRSSRRLTALDGFRGCAVLAVIFYHFSLPILASGPHDRVSRAFLHLLLSGSCGVDMFFVLSGLLITGILLDSRDREGYFSSFYARRVLRIFPLYYGVLIVAFVLLPGFAAIRPYVANQRWLWLYGSNFAGIWRVSFSPMFDHFWSLAIEEQFYFFWPIAVFLLPRRRLMELAVGLAAFSLLLRCALIGRGALDAETAASLAPCRLEGLLLGAILAMLARSKRGLAALRRPALAVGLLAAAAALVSRVACDPGGMWGLSGIGHLTMPLAFACVLARVAEGNGWGNRLMSVSTLRFFGKYSYGLYVFHYLFEPWLDRWFWCLPSIPIVSISLHLVLALLATLAVAVASWHLYEKQFLKLKRFFQPGPRRGTAALLPASHLMAGLTHRLHDFAG